MIYQLIEAIAWGLSSGTIAAVYKGILPYEFPPVSKWFAFGARFERRWFYKPLWGCAPCIAGQVALWSFLVIRILPPSVNAIGQIFDFPGSAGVYVIPALAALFRLILAISAAIVSGHMLTWYILKRFQ